MIWIGKHYSPEMEILKKNCGRRKIKALHGFIDGNSEIANWSRYLKEACIVYGKVMRAGGQVYCGLDGKLMFPSMQQHFECPISTTTNITVANQFAKGKCGIILILARASHKTRY